MKKPIFVEIVRLLIVLLCTTGGYGVAMRVGSPLLGAMLGAAVGYVAGGVGGRFLLRAMGEVEEHTARYSVAEFFAGAVGALLAGLLGALVGVSAIGVLPGRWGWPVFALIVWIAVYGGFRITRRKSSEMLAMAGLSDPVALRGVGAPGSDAVLLDTSVLVDGRLLQLARTGFLPRELLVPAFILEELGALADSPDPALRRKGRHGLESLEALRRDSLFRVRVLEEEVPEIEEIDAKLLALASRHSVSLMTNDQALGHIAEIRGVRCLNLQRLARSLRSVHVPGEVVHITLIKEGKASGEAIGFLDEGSMVVVADAADRLGQDAEVRITKVVRTPLGRMFFAALADS